MVLALVATTVASAPWAIGFAAVATVACLGIAIVRSRRESGHIDLFHPLAFPLLYTAVSFLLPTWRMAVSGDVVGGFSNEVMSPRTAGLMSAAVVATAAGLSLAPRIPRPRQAVSVVPRRLARLTGRGLLVLLIAVSLRDTLVGAVFSRGAGQIAYGMQSTIAAFAAIFTPAAVLLLTAERTTQTEHRAAGILSRLDWLLVGLLVVVSSVTGERGQAITVMLCLFYAWTRRKVRAGAVLAGFAGVTAFAVGILAYRNAMRPGYVTPPAFDALVRDLSVATYTTGVTADLVPAVEPFAAGGTYLAALVRQLPSPIANALLGPPYDTGTYAFRRLINADNPNHGWGFSLPAEGYLNFGVAGTLMACFVYGLAIAWFHGMCRKLPALAPAGLVYPLLVVTLPVALRSDALGSLKSVLYPLALAIALLLVVRLPWFRSRFGSEEASDRAA